MSENDRVVIAAMVRQDVAADIEKRLDSEKAFLMSAVKVAGMVVAVVAALITWAGWASLQSAKEQVKEEITTATKSYLTNSTNVAEIEDILDKYYTSTLILYHLQHSVDDADEQAGGEPLSLTMADAGKLVGVICKGEREEWVTTNAAAVLVTATVEPWWPRFERQLIDMVVPPRNSAREGETNNCRELEPTLRAAIVRLLIPHSSEDILSRLRPLLDSNAEEPNVRSAVLDYAASLGADAVPLQRLETFVASDVPDLRVSALEYLARWHPQNKRLAQWVSTNLRPAIGSSTTVSGAFRIVSVLFSNSMRDPRENIDAQLDPIRRVALREMIRADIKFFPVNLDTPYDLLHYVPFRWRVGSDDFDRPVPRVSAGHASRIGLERESFERVYVQIFNETTMLPLEEARSELTKLVSGLLVSSTTLDRAYVCIDIPRTGAILMGGRPISPPQTSALAYEVTLMNTPGTVSSSDDRSRPQARFVLHPINASGERYSGVEPIVASHIRGEVTAHIGIRQQNH